LKKGDFFLNKTHFIYTGKKKNSIIKFHGIAKKSMPKKSLSRLIKWRFCILDVLFTHTIVALLMAQVWTGHPTKFFLPKSFNRISNDPKNVLKNQYLMHLSSKIFQITFIKSYSLMLLAFQ
jgi:hypothetical protein